MSSEMPRPSAEVYDPMLLPSCYIGELFGEDFDDALDENELMMRQVVAGALYNNRTASAPLDHKAASIRPTEEKGSDLQAELDRVKGLLVGTRKELLQERTRRVSLQQLADHLVQASIEVHGYFEKRESDLFIFDGILITLGYMLPFFLSGSGKYVLWAAHGLFRFRASWKLTPVSVCPDCGNLDCQQPPGSPNLWTSCATSMVGYLIIMAGLDFIGPFWSLGIVFSALVLLCFVLGMNVLSLVRPFLRFRLSRADLEVKLWDDDHHD